MISVDMIIAVPLVAIAIALIAGSYYSVQAYAVSAASYDAHIEAAYATSQAIEIALSSAGYPSELEASEIAAPYGLQAYLMPFSYNFSCGYTEACRTAITGGKEYTLVVKWK